MIKKFVTIKFCKKLALLPTASLSKNGLDYWFLGEKPNFVQKVKIAKNYLSKH
jgi:hypothetical protein